MRRPGFVVQGGGYGAATNGTLPAPKPTDVRARSRSRPTGGSNVQWTVAMARTSDANSATSQFFFNLVDNTAPRRRQHDGYAVFADVTSAAPR